MLYGTDEKCIRRIRDLFQYHNIDIYAACNEDAVLCREVLTGIPILSLKDLELCTKTENNFMIQLVTTESESELLQYANDIGVYDFVSYTEASKILEYMKQQEDLAFLFETDRNGLTLPTDFKPNVKNRLIQYIKDNESSTYVFICMLGKTGDHTLVKTFQKQGIAHHNVWHEPSSFEPKIFDTPSTFKIITAVREPIGFLLSVLYQHIDDLNLFLLFSQFGPFEKEMIYENGGDVQALFNEKMNLQLQGVHASEMDYFLEVFNEHVFDIMKEPFDQESGYSIIQQGNIEVFVYQLEKMNDVAGAMSDFLGKSFEQWEKGNVAADKWLASSYDQAQKEIKISQEYFDRCFNAPYVKHFYSEGDIEKLKDRWRPHIIQ